LKPLLTIIALAAAVLGAAADKPEPTRTLKDIQAAAAKGEAQAQFPPSVHYIRGLGGVKKALPAAAKLYLTAARQGNVDAQLNYGVMCARGQGVPQNLPLAWAWMRASALQGKPNASANLKLFEKNFTAAEKKAAQAAWEKVATELKKAKTGGQNP